MLNCRGTASYTAAIAKELGGIAIAADVTDKHEVAALFEQAKSHYGRPISVVVNNALADYQFNGDARKKLETIEWDDFDKQIGVYVEGALNTTRAAIPDFVELGFGRIINIGSNLVQNPVVSY